MRYLSVCSGIDLALYPACECYNFIHRGVGLQFVCSPTNNFDIADNVANIITLPIQRWSVRATKSLAVFKRNAQNWTRRRNNNVIHSDQERKTCQARTLPGINPHSVFARSSPSVCPRSIPKGVTLETAARLRVAVPKSIAQRDKFSPAIAAAPPSKFAVFVSTIDPKGNRAPKSLTLNVNAASHRESLTHAA